MGKGLWGRRAGRVGWGRCSGGSHAQLLLCTDDSEGAAPAGAPSPGDGPCSPGETWVQGTHAGPCSPGCRPVAHHSLPLQMHNGSGCVCPVRPGPPGPKVTWSSPWRGTGVRGPTVTHWEKSHVCFGRAKPFLLRIWTLAVESGVGGRLRCPLAGGQQVPAVGTGGGKHEEPGAGSRALSFPDREKKATEDPREREASLDSLGREESPAARGSQVTRDPGVRQVRRDRRDPQGHQVPGEPGAHPCPLHSPRDWRMR